MVALIVVLLCLALLYFWLVGHWFARVLAFLALWPVFFLIATGGITGIFYLLPASPPAPLSSVPDRPVFATPAPAVSAADAEIERRFRATWGLPPPGVTIDPKTPANAHWEPGPVAGFILAMFCVVLGGLGAWAVAGIPTWHKRRRISAGGASAG